MSISVVVPWGKTEGNLNRAISSTLSQSLPPLEILIIANGKVTLEEMNDKKEILADSRVFFYYIPGCSNANIARNYGTALSNGEWIAYLDSDDWWDQNHLEESIKFLNDNQADFIYSGMRIYSSKGLKNLTAKDFYLFNGMRNYLLSYLPAPTPSIIVRRTVVLAQPWDVSLCRHQDYDFSARISDFFVLTFKENITVNVDWSNPVRHRNHKDCFRVLKNFRKSVSKKNHDRHFYNLFVSAIKCGDFSWINQLPLFIFIVNRKILNKLMKLTRKIN